ncbi:hypothetical protein FG386_000758 [Cryptosporidium ryanae]|uniref:uncharacterized protein n=1 Tax=Cryptosporidium ryanae TaxID=515981 RepID=UPI003519FD54|nr:hypothetical protein FG386_000758 [Cryptosporidium ryanae]
MEKRRQLMSSSEIISSTETNFSYLYKFISIISSRETVSVKNKCNIALKNLNSLVSVIEKGNIPINIITLMAINGILWHPDPCNNPNEILKYLQLYNTIKSTQIFNDPSLDFKSEVNENKNDNIFVETKPHSKLKDKINRGTIKCDVNVTRTLEDLDMEANDTRIASRANISEIETNIFNYTTTDSDAEHSKVHESTKSQIEKELSNLSKIKPVSSKSKEFKMSLERIYNERIQ